MHYTIRQRCAIRAFAGIDLAVENVSDATTPLNFRYLLSKLFDEIGISLCEQGLTMKGGTLVDATTIIEAPSRRPRTLRRAETRRCISEERQ